MALICPCDSSLTHRCVGACVAYNRVSAGRSDHCGAHHLLQGSNLGDKEEAKNAAALLMGTAHLVRGAHRDPCETVICKCHPVLQCKSAAHAVKGLHAI
jgi:hypothetical protein